MNSTTWYLNDDTYRPGFHHCRRTDAALLRTCQIIYSETHLVPAAINTHSIFHQRNRSLLQPMPTSALTLFKKFTPAQLAAVQHVFLVSKELSCYRCITRKPSIIQVCCMNMCGSAERCDTVFFFDVICFIAILQDSLYSSPIPPHSFLFPSPIRQHSKIAPPSHSLSKPPSSQYHKLPTKKLQLQFQSPK